MNKQRVLITISINYSSRLQYVHLVFYGVVKMNRKRGRSECLHQLMKGNVIAVHMDFVRKHADY